MSLGVAIADGFAARVYRRVGHLGLLLDLVEKMPGEEAVYEFTTRQDCVILRHMNNARSDASRTPIPAAYARALLRRFGQTPARRAELLEQTGLSEAALNAPGAEPPLHSVLELAARITRAEGEAWPLEAKAVWSNAMQGALDVAVRSAATFDEALSALARYGHIRAPYVSIRLHTTTTRRRIVFKPGRCSDAALWRAIALAVALSTRELFAQILEEDAAETIVEFPWAAPKHASRILDALSCTVRFNRRDFAMEFPAALGRRPSPFADASLHASALAELEDAASRLSGARPIVQDVERLIVLHLPRRLNEAEAASRLGLSRRTLVRRLGEANLSFRALADEVLRARAEAMRAAGKLSREEMAAALGYAEPTSFSRACRRWFPTLARRRSDNIHLYYDKYIAKQTLQVLAPKALISLLVDPAAGAAQACPASQPMIACLRARPQW